MCSICQEELPASETTLQCGHAFHLQCIVDWNTEQVAKQNVKGGEKLRTCSCPLCRAEVPCQDQAFVCQVCKQTMPERCWLSCGHFVHPTCEPSLVWSLRIGFEHVSREPSLEYPPKAQYIVKCRQCECMTARPLLQKHIAIARQFADNMRRGNGRVEFVQSLATPHGDAVYYDCGQRAFRIRIAQSRHSIQCQRPQTSQGNPPSASDVKQCMESAVNHYNHEVYKGQSIWRRICDSASCKRGSRSWVDAARDMAERIMFTTVKMTNQLKWKQAEEVEALIRAKTARVLRQATRRTSQWGGSQRRSVRQRPESQSSRTKVAGSQ